MDSSEAPCPINLLPAELLYRIFTSIDDPKTLCRAERTCHRWRSVIDSQALWRNLATKISNARILPERFNELGKGSLIAGTYISDEEGGHWNYMYRDLVRNIHSLNRIPDISHNNSSPSKDQDNLETEIKLEMIQVISSMCELSELPSDYAGSKDAYITRRIDFTSSAIEGMRLQPRPLQISKTPAFTDSLCPGETSSDETAWVYFADQLALWPRPHNDIIFETPPTENLQTTLQRGVLRTGTNGIFGEGAWYWPGPKKGEDSSDRSTTQLIEDEKGGPPSNEQKRPWKDGENPNETATVIAQEITGLSATEIAPIPKKAAAPDLLHPEGSLKWAAPIDSPHTLPHARRWDPDHTIFGSYRNTFNLTAENNSECGRPMVVESVINTLYGEMCNQAHSDPNLRIHYQRLQSTFPDIVAIKVDRLALPPSKSVKKDPTYPMEPIPIVNQSWNLFGKAKWSLNSVPFLNETEALEVERKAGMTYSSSESEPWWFHETRYQAGEEEPPNIWESAHKWEYRSCGDYLIISDDIGMSGPCTISCFKTGYHKEKSAVDPATYLRGAAFRNYLDTGPSSDLIWQKSLKSSGYTLDIPSQSPVHSLEYPNFGRGRPSYFLDNDGLAINSKVVVYATRKKVFFTLDSNSVIIREGSRQTLTCMEFHVIAIETGHTINILDLEHETRSLDIRDASWCGWTSFVMSDTHLIATVGGHVHDTQGAEQMDDSVARTWSRSNRYGREEVFVWPLDIPNQNLSLAPEERKILPTGRLAAGFNMYKWWRRDRYLSLSRDGRFLAASSKYMLIVWDLWLGDTKGVVYRFDEHANGLQGYDLSKIGDVAWNGIWVQYRDIIIDPNQKTFTNSNPNHEHELLRKVIFIPNSEVRLLLQGTNHDFEKTEEGKRAVKELETKLGRRYIPSTDSDNDDSSDSWTTDDDNDGDYEDDSDDYDSDGGGFRSNRYADDDDWDGEGDYDPDYGSDDDDEYDDDGSSGDSIQGFTVQRVSQPSESREQPSNVKKRKLEMTETAVGESSAAGSSRQDPVPVVGWGDAAKGDGKEDGWGTDNEDGAVDESW
ncbi:uncharacterized protein DFL_000374 [Arthrobotrys flagrans]|uniref:F-box domain-containing protein n=1 Tax=Arthrobotrys flagrans TaxID=97331 RepID=A0A437ADP2_ARTFL|nr:hypothetical protein DFL_000374 [Arthrobotrys flagrans]